MSVAPNYYTLSFPGRNSGLVQYRKVLNNVLPQSKMTAIGYGLRLTRCLASGIIHRTIFDMSDVPHDINK